MTIKISHFLPYRTFYVRWLVDHIDGTHKDGSVIRKHTRGLKGGTQGALEGNLKGAHKGGYNSGLTRGAKSHKGEQKGYVPTGRIRGE